MSIHYPDLAEELEGTHPVTGLPYSEDDQTAADQLNEENIELEKVLLSGQDVLNNLTDSFEFAQLNKAEDKQRWLTLCGGSGGGGVLSLDFTQGAGQAEMETIFGDGPTKTAIQLASGGLISRATQLGWPFITKQDVKFARSL